MRKKRIYGKKNLNYPKYWYLNGNLWKKERICGKKNLNCPKYWYLNGNLWKKEFKLPEKSTNPWVGSRLCKAKPRLPIINTMLLYELSPYDV